MDEKSEENIAIIDSSSTSQVASCDANVIKQSPDVENSDGLAKDSTNKDCSEQRSTVIRKPGYAPIKKEFLLLDYKPTLHAEFLSTEVAQKLQNLQKDLSEKAQKRSFDEDDEEKEEPLNKKAKLKGRNKHRPRTERLQAKDRICPSIKANKDCRYGDKCKFNHDKEDFAKKKPTELEGSCYLFDNFGCCPYGISCRFAKNHLSEDLNNIVNEELFEKMKGFKTLNELGGDVRKKLWKRNYNFAKADRVVKEVQKNFRGWGEDSAPGDSTKEGIKSNSVSVCENVKSSADVSGEQANVVSDCSTQMTATHESVAHDSNLPASVVQTGVNGDSITVTSAVQANESVLKNDISLTKVVSDSLPQVVTICDKATAAGGNTTLGCMTDEEVIRLRPLEKVKINFKNKISLAPLTTVGNLPFRRICKGFGADITCGEMALVTQLLKAKQSEWSLIKRHPSEDIFGVQICGSYPDTMTRCAQLLTENCQVDFIDINCGCPIDLVYKKGGGSALMSKATKLEQICRSMIGVMGDTALTVKLRTGVFDGKNIAHQIIPRLRNAGVSLVTVHGRSREQRYTKQADWDYIAECSAAGAPMPVFGNGDVLTYEDANFHMKQSGVSGVMVARGALIKPWIFTEIKEQRHWDISSGERMDILRQYTNYGLEHWGSDHQGVENTRRFLLEWLSFLYRYIPVGVLEVLPQRINERPPYYVGRNDLETLMASANCADWIKISEMLLGPVPANFHFLPKHKANAYQ
ncbi:unnamed protein product [Lymnaea stagnalis]|uniref:tRNA-dihydrouridine(47) synthase [NAD(P)(+)] n=1 Tax=Lymnaea stagnalis TaxID=6523 RepID=A0AAV2H8K5_LYMST